MGWPSASSVRGDVPQGPCYQLGQHRMAECPVWRGTWDINVKTGWNPISREVQERFRVWTWVSGSFRGVDWA